MTLRQLYDQLDWSIADESLRQQSVGKSTQPEPETVIKNRCMEMEAAMWGEGDERQMACIKKLFHFGVWQRIIEIMEREGMDEAQGGGGDRGPGQDRPGGAASKDDDGDIGDV